LLASYAAAQEEKHETTINLAAAVLCHMACNAATAQVMAKTHKLHRGTWGNFIKKSTWQRQHCFATNDAATCKLCSGTMGKMIIKAVNLVAPAWHCK